MKLDTLRSAQGWPIFDNNSRVGGIKPVSKSNKRFTRLVALCSSAFVTLGCTGHPEYLAPFEERINRASSHLPPVDHVPFKPSFCLVSWTLINVSG